MSANAAAAMTAVTIEVGSGSVWAGLREMVARGASAVVEGTAALHARAAREEAAKAVVTNHFKLLLDVCNPFGSLNIDGKPLTQTEELTRVSAALATHVDAALREATRRLLGGGPPEALDPSGTAARARLACAEYLDGRIQGTAAQKPGRKPDMSDKAAAAFKAVLREVAAPHGTALGVAAHPHAIDVASNLEALVRMTRIHTRSNTPSNALHRPPMKSTAADFPHSRQLATAGGTAAGLGPDHLLTVMRDSDCSLRACWVPVWCA